MSTKKQSARLALSNHAKNLGKLGASKGGIARMEKIRGTGKWTHSTQR